MNAPRFAIDPFDRDIVEFVLAWTPYGGAPDEETFPLFGLTAAGLRERFVEIVLGTLRCRLDAEARTLIVRAAMLIRALGWAPEQDVALPRRR